ncbi:4751_t:CDS:1, partial [Gigaspora rosea]
PNKPFFMECDASQYGIGAILYQDDENREHYKVKNMLSRKELLNEELQKDYSKPPKATRRIIEIGSHGLNA